MEFNQIGHVESPSRDGADEDGGEARATPRPRVIVCDSARVVKHSHTDALIHAEYAVIPRGEFKIRGRRSTPSLSVASRFR